MLLSEKHKFIFIHIYKNAGTSIARALLPYTSSIPYLPVLRNKLRVIYKFPEPYKGHVQAPELIKELGEERFNSFYSFAFVRNPWDWQVSLYCFMLKTKTHRHHKIVSELNSFDEYVEWRCREDVRYQKDFIYSQEGKLLVNFVGRYEKLNEDFDKVCSVIGVNTHLSELNVSNKKPYQEYYTKKSIELVREVFQPDIELFGYDFE